MFVRERERTPLYRKAVAALQELAATEGLDKTDRAYAEAVCDGIRQHTTKGLKLSRSCCIRRLLGGKCYHPGGVNDNHDCWPPGTDHPSLWNRDGKPEMFVSQPYGLSWRRLKEIVAFCETHGLQVDIDARGSWHFPGQTLLVTYRKEQPSSETIK